MSFVDRELQQINRLLPTVDDNDTERCLQAVRQALAWALEPNGFMSPLAYIEKFYGLKKDSLPPLPDKLVPAHAPSSQ